MSNPSDVTYDVTDGVAVVAGADNLFKAAADNWGSIGPVTCG